MSTPPPGAAPATPASPPAAVKVATPAPVATQAPETKAEEAKPTPAKPEVKPAAAPKPAEAKPAPAANPAPAKPAPAKPAETKPAAAAPAQPAASVTPSVNPVDAARVLRQKRARKLAKGLVGWVAVPTLVAAVYLGFVAHDQFESVASIALRGPDASEDALMLRDYVASRAILNGLDSDHKLSAHFKQAGDAVSRLSPKASKEAFFEYYTGKASASFDSRAGVLTLRFRAFSGKVAQTYAARIVKACERLLRDTGAHATSGRLKEAQAALEHAETSLLQVSRALGELEASVKTKATPAELGELEAKRMEKQLAERSFESARASLEHLRSERSKQTHFSVVAPASMPDQATHPRRLYGVLTTFLAALAFFGTGRLLVAAAREHASF